MKVLINVAAIAALALIAGCATKRYPIAAPLSPTETSLMNCRELALEADRIESTRTQITDTAQTDWRSIAGFLGDYGIGNAMARSEAEAALQTRSQTIRSAQTTRGCMGPNEPAAIAAAQPTPAPVAAPAAPSTP